MTIESFITDDEPATRLGAFPGILGAVAVFDFVIHLEHRLSHAVPVPWRLTLIWLMPPPFRRQPVADDPAARPAP